ncbi:uncharacterized protein LOC120139420 [Hibiscus syriacus]|uniref:uncharacterized protein LOC120139420 n=1 Tax=Hibiscus syriacus TaxID=106335 RepID=UPI001922D34B|nr:uncharacterized protein LOC120139420 [Hibiscus syriacus]
MRRNKVLFDPDFVENESVLQASWRFHQEAMYALQVRDENRKRMAIDRRKEEWLPPARGLFKLNTDGARNASKGLATCGGVIRMNMDVGFKGSRKLLGFVSILDAELWGFYEGLCLAQSIGIRQLCVENSKDASSSLALLQGKVTVLRTQWQCWQGRWKVTVEEVRILVDEDRKVWHQFQVNSRRGRQTPPVGCLAN